MTTEEASTVDQWKKQSAGDSAEDELQEPGTEFDIMNREWRKKKLKLAAGSGDSEYDSAIKHCVLGSAAEVERVWSMAGHVLTQHRASMSPLLFEIIMYLKYNARLWGFEDVIEANTRREQSTEAAKKRAEYQKERKEAMLKECEDDTWSEWEKKGGN